MNRLIDYLNIRYQYFWRYFPIKYFLKNFNMISTFNKIFEVCYKDTLSYKFTLDILLILPLQRDLY